MKPFSERQDDVLHSTLQKINSQDLKKLFEQERTITSLVVATPFDFNISFFFGHRVHPAEARPDTADWG